MHQDNISLGMSGLVDGEEHPEWFLRRLKLLFFRYILPSRYTYPLDSKAIYATYSFARDRTGPTEP